MTLLSFSVAFLITCGTGISGFHITYSQHGIAKKHSVSTFDRELIKSASRRSSLIPTWLAAANASPKISSASSDTIGVPRLHHDLSGLIRWIEKSGGTFDAGVQKGSEGWNLLSERTIEEGETILSIPKSICIFSNPAYMSVPLLENAQLLMTSLEENQWRARLAVALLSERVRPSSHYRAYLRNLPFEFWGMPVFYSTQEFSIMQDLTLMQRTRDRCRFLSEFADGVLTPLQKTTRDPFSGHNADVNAFGWGFASAASRALRNPSVIGKEDGQVMVPGVDLADHNPFPSCAVIEDPKRDSFLLVAAKKIQKGEALTINYGPLSSDELLSDYGFTVDNNPNDKMTINCDYDLLHLARLVMGQTEVHDDGALLSPLHPNSATAADSHTIHSAIGRGGGGQKLDDRWLYQWQVYWLSVLNLYGPTAQYSMSVGGPSVSTVDPRLWAFLRILYAKKEDDLLKHGYTPFSLMSAGSVLSADIEAQVIKTLVGVTGVLLRVYGSDMKADLQALTTEKVDYEAESKSAGGQSVIGSSTEDIVVDVRRILKLVLKDALPDTQHAKDKKSSSKTSRNADPETSSSRIAAADTASKTSQGPGQGQGIRGFRDGVASEGTPYRIAVGTFEPSVNDREVEETDKDIWSPHSATETSDTVHSTGSDTEGASSAEESEGSLEDAIASMSGKIDRTSATVPATATTHSEDGAATDTTSASSSSSSTQQSTASGSGAESASKLKSDAVSVGVVVGSISVSSLGSGLPINVREALRYRIRKKISLMKLVSSLGELHTTVRNTRHSGKPSAPSKDTQSSSDLLGLGGDKGERRAKIRELVDEVRNRVPKEDILVTASKISSKWSGRGLAL